ncbi:ornithine cyclodeaminase family protein [Pendulispora brunnea]|uniref:Ornithine cyclodeaminase family protein n=1 Tax=Pendulispora brunnea TaxID=2905690 RepID=A0ABZ2K245_9BACT
MACGGADLQMAADDVAEGFALLLEKRVQLPKKTSLQPCPGKPESETGFFNVMPSLVQHWERDVLGCKIMGSMPGNVERGLPRASGFILLFDPETKLPMCVMDAQAISATRTGAVSLLAARRLARSSTRELGLVGAGINMRTQLLGLSAALPELKRVRVHARGLSRHRFAEEMGARTGLSIVAVDSPEEAVRGADTIVTCVSVDHEPIVRAPWIAQRGVTIFSIGGFEVDLDVLTRMDRVVADRWEDVRSRGVQAHAIAVERGLLPASRVEDLGPILAGLSPGRRSDEESIFFSPVGLAFEDVLVAHRVYRTAVARGVGHRFRTWRNPQWI